MIANTFLPIASISEENSLLLYGTFIDNSKSDFEFEYALQETPETRDEPFYYHAELLDVLTESLKGSEASNINLAKVQEVFKLKYLASFLLEKDDLLKKKDKGFKFDLLKQAQCPPIYEDFDSIVEKNYELILEKNEEAMSLLKPKILEIMNLIYFSPPKISIERIYKCSNYFIGFFQNEEKRLTECEILHDLQPRDLKYLFEDLINFLKIYNKKLLANEMNAELSERDDKIAINSIYQFIQKNLNCFKGKLTSQQNKNLKSFFASIKEADAAQKEKIKNELYDLELEKPLDKVIKRQEENELNLIWEMFLKNFLNSSILEKVI